MAGLVPAIGTFVYRYSNNSGTPQASPAVIVKLTRQAARWLVAAQQDESPMIAFLHLQYGMGYVWALSDVTTPESYKAATGQDWKLLENKAQMMQDQVTKRMVKACPQFAGDVDKYLGRLAGDI
jgi:hypothetical protein